MAEEIHAAAERWRAEPQHERLLRGRALDEARRVAKARPAMVSTEGRAFLAASRRFDIRARAGIAALVSSVLIGAVVFVALYLRAQRDAESEKAAAHEITRQLLDPRSVPEPQRIEQTLRLLQEKRACERALEQALDAGARCP